MGEPPSSRVLSTQMVLRAWTAPMLPASSSMSVASYSASSHSAARAESSGGISCRVMAGLPSGAGRPGGGCRAPPVLERGLVVCPERGADLGPGIAGAAQAGDGLGDGVIDLGGQAEHEGQGLDVAVSDAAGIGPQDAAGERGILVVLDHAPGPVG